MACCLGGTFSSSCLRRWARSRLQRRRLSPLLTALNPSEADGRHLGRRAAGRGKVLRSITEDVVGTAFRNASWSGFIHRFLRAASSGGPLYRNSTAPKRSHPYGGVPEQVAPSQSPRCTRPKKKKSWRQNFGGMAWSLGAQAARATHSCATARRGPPGPQRPCSCAAAAASTATGCGRTPGDAQGH